MDALIENTKLRTYKALKRKKLTISDQIFKMNKSDDILWIVKILKLAKYNQAVIDNLRIIICSDIKLQEYIFYIASIKLHHNILARAMISYIKDYMVDNNLDYRYLFIVYENYEKTTNIDHYKEDLSINKRYVHIPDIIMIDDNNLLIGCNDVVDGELMNLNNIIDVAFLNNNMDDSDIGNLILKSNNINNSNLILKSNDNNLILKIKCDSKKHLKKYIKKLSFLSSSIIKKS